MLTPSHPISTQKNNKPLLIVSMGNTYSHIADQYGDFSDWIYAEIILNETTHIHAQHDILPNPIHFSGIIISGAHEMVTASAAWSIRVSEWLKTCYELNIPLLGICYGHQLIAQTFGGSVANNINGLEVGTQHIHLHDEAKHDALFFDFPTQITAQLIHYQSAITLPKDATILASNPHEPHQAFRLGNHIWGMQFHPEFNSLVMQAYVDTLRTEGNLSNTAMINIDETPHATSLLERFSDFCNTYTLERMS